MIGFLNRQLTAGPSARSAWQGKRFPLLLGLLALGVGMSASQAGAATCNLSLQGINFGSYDPFSSVALDSTGNIGVTCDISAPYSIALSPGGGSYALRAMANGTYSLTYNLYTDATRTTVWGDGSSGTSVVNGNGTTENHALYGRIPARQNAYVGNYSDIITVTLTY